MSAPAVPVPATFDGATILVAAINETYSLRQTVEALLAHAASFGGSGAEPPSIVEILLLLSPKKTTPECLATAKSLEQTGPVPVRIVYQTLPFIGGAYRTGFDEARGSHVLMMSADLETDPAVVPAMLAEARRAPGVVVATSRWLIADGFSGYGGAKRVCNALFQWFFRLLYGTRLTDLTFGFRVFPLATMRAIAWREVRHPFFLESCLAPLRLGVPFVELPARWVSRTEGESQNSFLANFRYFKTAFRIRFCPRSSLLLSPKQ